MPNSLIRQFADSLICPILAVSAPGGRCRAAKAEGDDHLDCIMQNKANFKIGKIDISIATIKDYDNERRTINNERYSKQTQTKPISRFPILQYVAKWGPSDYPCVVELARYNLVLRDDNMKDFDGEYVKCQVHRKQMQ
jgi:hypothetical protein